MTPTSPFLSGLRYTSRPRAIIVADNPEAVAIAADAAESAGVEVIDSLSFERATSDLGALGPADIVLIETCGNDMRQVEQVVELNEVLLDLGTKVIVALDDGAIDAVASRIFGGHAQLLCEPTPTERVIALLHARPAPTSPRVRERSRDASDERLQRLNEEVARIAETLARLTRGDDLDAAQPGVRDRSPGYGAPPPMLPTSGKAGWVRAIIRARRLRDQYLGEGLFADPAWDMLLDLYAAHLEGAQVSVSSLCIASAVPSTTALRWIQTMHERGLFERHEDPFDRRRAYIGLSERARIAMAAYFEALGEGAPKPL